MDETQPEEIEEIEEKAKASTYWWVRQIILVAIAGFYLVFGIQLLISAYQLNDPTSFIFTFYASNFMILFSGALLIGFIYRMVTAYRQLKLDSND